MKIAFATKRTRIEAMKKLIEKVGSNDVNRFATAAGAAAETASAAAAASANVGDKPASGPR